MIFMANKTEKIQDRTLTPTDNEGEWTFLYPELEYGTYKFILDYESNYTTNIEQAGQMTGYLIVGKEPFIKVVPCITPYDTTATMEVNVADIDKLDTKISHTITFVDSSDNPIQKLPFNIKFLFGEFKDYQKEGNESLLKTDCNNAVMIPSKTKYTTIYNGEVNKTTGQLYDKTMYGKRDVVYYVKQLFSTVNDISSENTMFIEFTGSTNRGSDNYTPKTVAIPCIIGSAKVHIRPFGFSDSSYEGTGYVNGVHGGGNIILRVETTYDWPWTKDDDNNFVAKKGYEEYTTNAQYKINEGYYTLQRKVSTGWVDIPFENLTSADNNTYISENGHIYSRNAKNGILSIKWTNDKSFEYKGMDTIRFRYIGVAGKYANNYSNGYVFKIDPSKSSVDKINLYYMINNKTVHSTMSTDKDNYATTFTTDANNKRLISYTTNTLNFTVCNSGTNSLVDIDGTGVLTLTDNSTQKVYKTYNFDVKDGTGSVDLTNITPALYDITTTFKSDNDIFDTSSIDGESNIHTFNKLQYYNRQAKITLTNQKGLYQNTNGVQIPRYTSPTTPNSLLDSTNDYHDRLTYDLKCAYDDITDNPYCDGTIALYVHIPKTSTKDSTNICLDKYAITDYSRYESGTRDLPHMFTDTYLNWDAVTEYTEQDNSYHNYDAYITFTAKDSNFGSYDTKVDYDTRYFKLSHITKARLLNGSTIGYYLSTDTPSDKKIHLNLVIVDDLFDEETCKSNIIGSADTNITGVSKYGIKGIKGIWKIRKTPTGTNAQTQDKWDVEDGSWSTLEWVDADDNIQGVNPVVSDENGNFDAYFDMATNNISTKYNYDLWFRVGYNSNISDDLIDFKTQLIPVSTSTATSKNMKNAQE